VSGRANHLSISPSQPPRSTQPTTLRGTRNEYQPKCGDALRLESKGRMALSMCHVCVGGKTARRSHIVNLSVSDVIAHTHTHIKRYANVLFTYFQRLITGTLTAPCWLLLLTCCRQEMSCFVAWLPYTFTSQRSFNENIMLSTSFLDMASVCQSDELTSPVRLKTQSCCARYSLIIFIHRQSVAAEEINHLTNLN